MRSLIDTMKERSTDLATKTRDVGLDALEKVRSGTVDWHRVLEGRKAEIANGNGTTPKWLKLGKVQIFVIDRVDRVLEAFGERVRDQIRRLSKLELGAETSEPATEASTPKKTPSEPKAKRVKTPAKAAKTSRAKPKKKKPAAKGSKKLVMPIAGYDDMTAKEVISEVSRLSPAQAETVREHEAANKKRKTVLRALDARLAA